MHKTFSIFLRAGVAFALVSFVGVSAAHAQSAVFTTNFPNGSAAVYVNTPPIVMNEAPQPMYVNVQPPPPPMNVVVADPAPIPGYVWVRGHYAWTGAAWAWVPARWIAAQPDCTWVAPAYDSGRRAWIQGHWRRGHNQHAYRPAPQVVYTQPAPQYYGPAVYPPPHHRGPVYVQPPVPPRHRGPVYVQPPVPPRHRGPVYVQPPVPQHRRGAVVVPAPQPPNHRGPANGHGGGNGRGNGHGRGRGR